MIDLYLEKYNGEMFFDISDVESDNEYLSFVFKATYNNKVIGAKITIPVVIKRSFFKGTKLLKDSGSLTISSIGEESDNFICALEELFKPDYKSTRRFTDEPEPIDYVVLNRGLYEFGEDKIYIKLCNKLAVILIRIFFLEFFIQTATCRTDADSELHRVIGKVCRCGLEGAVNFCPNASVP